MITSRRGRHLKLKMTSYVPYLCLSFFNFVGPKGSGQIASILNQSHWITIVQGSNEMKTEDEKAKNIACTEFVKSLVQGSCYTLNTNYRVYHPFIPEAGMMQRVCPIASMEFNKAEGFITLLK